MLYTNNSIEIICYKSIALFGYCILNQYLSNRIVQEPRADFNKLIYNICKRFAIAWDYLKNIRSCKGDLLVNWFKRG